MRKIKFKIIDSAGLHARPASQLAKEASQFQSTINLIHNEKIINLKSVIAIMSQGISSNSEITIEIEGIDEGNACSVLSQIVESLGIGVLA